MAVAAVGLLAVVAATVPAPVAAARPEAPVRLHADGRWLIDDKGRTVILHGVNFVWKRPPWVPPDEPGGFTTADADFLSSNGFNAVRLGVLFAGVMPTRGTIDQSYLDQVDRVVRLLAQRRIWVLLDFHQDMFTQWPGWAIPWNNSLPDDRNYGFPGNYFASAYLNAAYDNLWADSNDVWGYYRQFTQAVATRFAGRSYVLGYDLMNEPWPGTKWPECLYVTGCPDRDADIQRFQENASAGIRAADPVNTVWFEPNPLSLYTQPSHLGDNPVDDTVRPLGFTWHAYCGTSEVTGATGPDCATELERNLTNAEQNGKKLDAPLLLGEFGNTDDVQHLSETMSLTDQHRLSWLYWSYKGDGFGGESRASMFTDSNDLSTLKQDKADVLIRPYPRVVDGLPQGWTFDPGLGTFHFSYQPRGLDVTEIYVPQRHYTQGYRVDIQGGTVTSKPNAAILKVAANRDATSVDVTLTPNSD